MRSNRKGTILIADDNPTNLEVLFEVLKLNGFKVLVAVDGESALEQVQYTQPDIILLDVMMPGMSGFDVCQHLKVNDITKEIPVIFMTALSETVDKVRGFELGAVDYVTKPLQHEEVVVRVTTHLTLRNLQRALQQANDELEQRVAERTAELAQANANLKAEIAERKRAYQELDKTTRAYSRFVPKELLRLLDQDSITNVKLGDQVYTDMTILFSDIRSFTTLSEQMTPQENFNFINAYLGRVSPVIRKHHGFIDKYIGDAIMALFPDRPDYAIQAAIAMQREVAQYNSYRQKRGYIPLKIGISLHTGSLMLGTIGEAERMEGTVISDAVNQAARMEGLTKRYEASIIVSTRTMSQLETPEKYNYRFLEKVKVKGKTAPIALFEVFDGDPTDVVALKKKTKTDFEQALLFFYDQNFVDANECIGRVLAENPTDKAAQLYQQRIAYYLENGAEPDWTGIEDLTEK